MEIINNTTDFRNYKVILVKGNEEEIREHFELEYPNNDIAVMEHLNNMGTFEVVILPKEIEE